MALRWLCLDMNAFFASVEQQRRPALRGKPVAVVPTPAETTCCIAVSYEARAFGIRTGTNVAEARRLCPHLFVVPAGEHGPYQQYSERIRRAVEGCIPVTAMPFVDELFCRLWANERRTDDAVALGKEIKAAIRAQVGECLRCSVGLAPNRFLAKVATELRRPDGLVVLDDDSLPHALFPLRLTDFPGISRRMEARFQAVGVWSTEQMYALTQEQMRSVWGGVVGERWWRQIHGEDVQPIPTRRHCVSHSHVLPPELRTRHGAASVAGRLLEKAAERMRHLGFQARGLSVYVRSGDDRTWSAKKRLSPCQDTWTLMGVLRSLWEHPFPKPRQVGVTLYDVIPDACVTLPLFTEQEQRRRAARAVDRINQRFGRGTLTMASVLPVCRAAADKIAFGKIADLG